MATQAAKATLRSVAAEAVADDPLVDYFPSYEIITHPAYRGRFFAPNLRSVLPEGVDHVMTQFFRDQAAALAYLDQHGARALHACKNGGAADGCFALL